jgi:hypothetical protein
VKALAEEQPLPVQLEVESSVQSQTEVQTSELLTATQALAMQNHGIFDMIGGVASKLGVKLPGITPAAATPAPAVNLPPCCVLCPAQLEPASETLDAKAKSQERRRKRLLGLTTSACCDICPFDADEESEASNEPTIGSPVTPTVTSTSSAAARTPTRLVELSSTSETTQQTSERKEEKTKWREKASCCGVCASQFSLIAVQDPFTGKDSTNAELASNMAMAQTPGSGSAGNSPTNMNSNPPQGSSQQPANSNTNPNPAPAPAASSPLSGLSSLFGGRG